jgi:hypothetical protein
MTYMLDLQGLGIINRGPCTSCDTASTSHHCILVGTHGTCQHLLLSAYFFFRFQSQHLISKGLHSLYQCLNLCLFVERDLLPARHGAICDSWNNSSLRMYVDDGLLFACAESWDDVTTLLRARYLVCANWLIKAGLAIELDKTELLFFQKPYEHNPMPAPTRLILPHPEINSYFTVQPVNTLCYLGFFIKQRLKWEPHVWIMCNRARASIKALQVLGNSIHSLSMANW